MEAAHEATSRVASRRSWGLGRAETLRLLPIFVPVVAIGAASLGAAVYAYAAHMPSVGNVAGTLVLLAAAIFAEAYPVPVERLPSGSVALAAVFVLGAGILFG